MQARFDFLKTSPEGFPPIQALEAYLKRCGLEEGLLYLIKLRASQINGCAFCIDMHWKDLKAIGETEQRMYALDAWREYGCYTERERAALAWTESVTLIADQHASDSDYEYARAHFTEKELGDLTLAIAVINAWNRLSISSRAVPGRYEATRRK